MPSDVISNVLPFPSHHLSRHDRALIETWRVRAAPLGIAVVKVRTDGGSDAQTSPHRIAIQFRRGVADGQFVVIQRVAGQRSWVTLRLRVEPDGSMSLPLDTAEPVRQDASLRIALNAIRPVLPDEERGTLLNYQAAARSSHRRAAAPADRPLAKVT
jgi:uncharacterized phage protein gp47/JayE